MEVGLLKSTVGNAQKVGNIITRSCFNIIIYITAGVCNSPLPPNNGAITEMKVTDEGVNVTYRCNDGFTPTGDITALCNANGTWNNNPVDTVCTAVTKGSLNSCFDYFNNIN